jgi:hypothetical protein
MKTITSEGCRDDFPHDRNHVLNSRRGLERAGAFSRNPRSIFQAFQQKIMKRSLCSAYSLQATSGRSDD